MTEHPQQPQIAPSARFQALQPSWVLRAYAGVLAGIAMTMATILVSRGGAIGEVWVVLCLSIVAALAERSSVKLTPTTEISISVVPTLFAAVLFGPLAAMVVAAASMVNDLWTPGDRAFLKWTVYTSSRSITAAVAGVVAIEGRDVVGGDFGGLALASVLAALVVETLNIVFASTTRALRGNGKATDLARHLAPLAAIAITLYAPVVALLVIAYEQLSPWTLPLFILPSLAAQQLFGLYQAERRLAQDLVRVNRQLERANISFATALVATIEARDRYTAGHSAAVAIYARDIAARMGLPEETQNLAHLCGLVHDVGKIGLPVGLLEKPGALTLEERRLMETHSEIGERILAKVEDYAEIAAIVRHHHERMDGLGYPDKLRGDEIPLISRIIAVADAYNAMTSDRPYRDAMPTRVARLRLAQAADSQFDTSVVAAFEAILARATEAYRIGERNDFRLEMQDRYPERHAIAV